ncbi:hypothetical protein AB0E21_29120 [Streptomyces sp. NPDC047967]|uniref:hypothetical protein n=1 Tax=Streptomyces sp. NPDC047967 TaxID=3154924 RepID=UPI0033D454B5
MSALRLESWRRAGLLPRHRRRGLGRGRGSVVDALDPVVVESAAALGRHARQGRDSRLAVLDWFAEAGRPRLPGSAGAVVPEPPAAAVREAVLWALRRSASMRLLEVARGAAGAGEQGQDALYAAVGEMLAARPYRGAVHPAVVRAALEAGEDVPEGPAEFAGVVHLVAAIGLGVEEVGADALAESFAALGMFGLTVQDWEQMLGAAERDEGPPVDWGSLQQQADVLGPVQRAGHEDLLRAREVLLGLQGFYAMHVWHALWMPDTPGLAALRAVIDERGMFPVLDHMIGVSPSPTQFAEALAACLEPYLDELYTALMEQLAADPAIFHLPGDDTGAAGFMDTWLRTLREQTGKDTEQGSR